VPRKSSFVLVVDTALGIGGRGSISACIDIGAVAAERDSACEVRFHTFPFDIILMQRAANGDGNSSETSRNYAMKQAVGDVSISDWKSVRVYALPVQSGLSRRAETVYGWIAGILAFLIPWSDMLLLPYDVQFTRPLIALAVLSWLFSWRAGNVLRRVGFPTFGMMLFVLLVPAHFLTADDPERIGRRMLSYLGLFLMALFLQQTIRSWQTYCCVLRSFIAGCSVTLGGLVFNVLAGVQQGDGRYSAPGFDPNDLAGQIALSIPLASYLAFKVASGAIWFRLYLPVAVVGVLLTGSRAGLIILLLACTYPALCLLRRTKHSQLGIVIAVLCMACTIHYVSPKVSFHRFATIGEELSRGDLNGRGTVWKNGLQLFRENPVFGIGAGGFSGSVSGNLRIAAHNTYLEVLVEHGIVGLLVFLGIVFGLLWRTKKFPAEERMLWRVVIGAWMLLVMTLSWENREYTWLIWALCCSYVARTSNLRSLIGGVFDAA
jgi:O-antigen ligase